MKSKGQTFVPLLPTTQHDIYLYASLLIYFSTSHTFTMLFTTFSRALLALSVLSVVTAMPVQSMFDILVKE